jgi:hypothetical protein
VNQLKRRIEMGVYYTKSNPSGCIITDDNGKILTFDAWHKMNGKWVNIAQVFTEEKTKFYTDGKLEK